MKEKAKLKRGDAYLFVGILSKSLFLGIVSFLFSQYLCSVVKKIID